MTTSRAASALISRSESTHFQHFVSIRANSDCDKIGVSVSRRTVLGKDSYGEHGARCSITFNFVEHFPGRRARRACIKARRVTADWKNELIRRRNDSERKAVFSFRANGSEKLGQRLATLNADCLYLYASIHTLLVIL